MKLELTSIMKIFSVITLLLIIQFNVKSQNIHFEECYVNPMYPMSQTPVTFEHASFKDYLLEKLPSDFFKKVRKDITIQLLIDKDGKVCCNAILNYGKIDTEVLKNCINEMPDWIPAYNGEKAINVSTIFKLQIKKGILKKVEFLAG